MSVEKPEVRKKAIRRPWVFGRRSDPLDSSGIDQRDHVPWDRRQWYLDAKSGRLTEIHQRWEGIGDAAVAVEMVQSPPPGSGETYSYKEVEETFAIAEEHGCTISEAAIAVKGTGAFAPDYIQKCLKSKRQCVAKIADPIGGETSEVKDVEFVDPRIKARKKARAKKKAAAAAAVAATPASSEE